MEEKKENIFIRFLKKLGIIEEVDDKALKKKLCQIAIRSNICPESCETCDWNTK